MPLTSAESHSKDFKGSQNGWRNAVVCDLGLHNLSAIDPSPKSCIRWGGGEKGAPCLFDPSQAPLP